MTSSTPNMKDPVEADELKEHRPDALAMESAHSPGADDAYVEDALVDAELDVEAPERIVTMSRSQLLRRRFLRNPGAWVGMIGFGTLVLLAIFAPMFYHYTPNETDLRNVLSEPSRYHWFGVNEFGHDVFARTMQGLRISIIIGLGTAVLTMIIAVIVGTISGWMIGRGRLGSFIDITIVNLINLFLVIPSLLLLMLFSTPLQQWLAERQGGLNSLLGTTFELRWLVLIPLLALFSWMLAARVLRAMTQQLVRTDYVQAARFMGVNPVVNTWRHVLPNVASWIIIDTTLGVSAAILGETGLSFIGFGIQYPLVSLGKVLSEYNIAFPHTWVWPALVLGILVISINLMGEALRDALDPTSGSSRL